MQQRARALRVLVVDDERTFGDVIGEFLKGEGYAVLRAGNAVSALQLLLSDRTQPDLVLCDVMMPEMRGDQFAAETRRLLPRRRLPIVLLSASGDPRVQLRDVSFLPKPLDFGELGTLFRRLLPQRPAVSIATL